VTRAADRLIGSVIAGRYEVVRVIGKGGIGTIYEVKNTRLGRSFALKTLTGSDDEDVLARFRREAEIVAKLRHPNILEVVDWDTLDDGSPCMVMEYLVGEDLAKRLRDQHQLAWPELARIADEVLAALAVAHRAGVVHRDLKPQNIFLARDDAGEERVKLLDFGISKLRDARAFTTTDARVIGTPMYMPPEQAEGRNDDIGPATDVWAMGAILYEAATGKQAFFAPSVPAILYRVVHDRPTPMTELRPDTPPALVALIDRALTRELDRRLASVEQMRADLRAAFGSEPLRRLSTPAVGVRTVDPIATDDMIDAAAATTTPSHRRSRLPWIATIGGVAALAGAAWYLWPSSRSVEPAAAPAAAQAPAPASAPAPIVARPAPAPAARITVTITSKPSDAEVFRLPSEVKVGVTPWTSELERVEGSGVFVVKKHGYIDQQIDIDLRSGGERAVELAKIATAAPVVRARVPAAVQPAATGRKKGEPADPFSKEKQP
jgi:serine/threonine-protein kinase